MEIRFKMRNETKGAIRYEECDLKGNAIGKEDAKVGTFYVRKSAYAGSTPPPTLVMKLDNGK